MPKQRDARRPRNAGKDHYTVVSNLPDPLPITLAEIELLERELADFFEKLLGEGTARGPREVS
jgi:hypothetical protein